MADFQHTTRRALLGGPAVIPILGSCVILGESDPTIDACRKWLKLAEERSQFESEWMRYGKLLSQKFPLDRMSDAEWDSLPEMRRLDDMNARLEALEWRSDALFKALPTTPAASAAAVAANLSVASALLSPVSEPDVHGLIARAVRDLNVLGKSA